MQKELERCYELTYMLDHWQIGDEVTLAGPLGEFVYLPVRDGKTVIVFPSARIASICGSNSLILVYFLDITKPPRVVLLSYTGRSFVYCLLFTDRFNKASSIGYALFHFYRKEVAMKLGEKIKLVRKHRGLTQRELGERLHLDGNAANRIAQYESGFRTPKESRTKDIAKALNVREENFFTRAETPEDIIRLMIWYDWEHGCGGSVPIDTILLFDNFEKVEKLLKEWYSQKEKLRTRKITGAEYLEWMLQ